MFNARAGREGGREGEKLQTIRGDQEESVLSRGGRRLYRCRLIARGIAHRKICRGDRAGGGAKERLRWIQVQTVKSDILRWVARV